MRTLPWPRIPAGGGAKKGTTRAVQARHGCERRQPADPTTERQEDTGCRPPRHSPTMPGRYPGWQDRPLRLPMHEAQWLSKRLHREAMRLLTVAGAAQVAFTVS